MYEVTLEKISKRLKGDFRWFITGDQLVIQCNKCGLMCHRFTIAPEENGVNQ